MFSISFQFDSFNNSNGFKIILFLLAIIKSSLCQEAISEIELSDNGHLKNNGPSDKVFELADISSNRFFIPDYTFSINLIPFLLLLKVAFILGLLF